MPYLKLKDLAEKKETFTIMNFNGRVWKKWDNGKMLESEAPISGYDCKFILETKNGILEVSEMQFMNLLLRSFNPNTISSTLLGNTFEVSTNGQTGLDVRYYFKRVSKTASEHDELTKAARMSAFVQTGTIPPLPAQNASQEVPKAVGEGNNRITDDDFWESVKDVPAPKSPQINF